MGKQNKKQKIMKTALQLFVERGFHNTPTSLISQKAGIATGTLFNYFENKDLLINELYIEIKQEVIHTLKDCFFSYENYQEKIYGVFAEAIKWGIINPLEYRFTQQFCNSPFITKMTKDKAQNLLDFIMVTLEEICKLGIVKVDSPELLMDYFEGIINLTINHFLKYPEKISQENIHKMFEICWEGIGKGKLPK